MTFRALVARKSGETIVAQVEAMDDADLHAGDVTIAVEWSTVNYKDGAALSGRAGIIKAFPLIPGIDLAGVVESSSDPRFTAGDRVVVNSWGMSQTHHGGYAERARVPGDWVIKLPDAISTRHAMAIGTAGYTAMLSVLALEHGGVTPDKGDILVTGAAGGVGSVAIALLSRLGYRVIASTGRPQEQAYLTALGAAEIIDRATLSQPATSPIGAERWAGVIDSVGSHTLANALAQTKYRGVVTACGLAQGMDLPATVLPFILRNITLAGIDSVNAPNAVRVEAYARLARDLDLAKLESTVTEVGLAEAPQVAQAVLRGEIRGRALVDVRR
ncbi:acrylyl-CoA reductase (NADPH) [Phenylobacterium sp.]|uniref:acrylyl-CoA reductase (NADPH) n=1 Tax=Phenylobacterium sp. TaxID=1871053 RepID=UPI002FC9CF25